MSGEVIIIEGCDKAGKSTLAHALAEKLLWPVKAFRQPQVDPPVDEYLGWTLAAAGPFIADRFHLGQLVYGPVYRGERDNRFRFRLLELLLLARGALLVYLSQEPAVLEERFKRDRESFAKREDIGRLLGLYDQAYRWSCLPKVAFNIGGTVGLRLAVEEVLVTLAALRPLPPEAWCRREVVGSLRARALLVGDERNIGNRAEEAWRRVPFYSAAGDYLLHALDEAGLAGEVLLGNSKSTDKRVLDAELLGKLNGARFDWLGVAEPLPVVALGQAAEGRLRRAGIPVAATVPHPQWWRRFHPRDLVGYCDALRGAVLKGASWAGSIAAAGKF